MFIRSDEEMKVWLLAALSAAYNRARQLVKKSKYMTTAYVGTRKSVMLKIINGERQFSHENFYLK